MAQSGSNSHNQLLTMLSRDDFRLLEPDLEPLVLPTRFPIEDANKSIKHVYFMEAGIASVVAVSTHAREIEVGIIGREGMSGVTVVMGNDRSPHSTYIQVAGRGLRLKADELRAAMKQSPSLQKCFLHFAQAFMIQTAHTALANGRARIEERLARWILMARDRLDSNELPLTHEFLALMLGVRRAGVTAALHELLQQGLVDSTRGNIIVRDRPGLEEAADGSYGVPEAEYRRLTGWRPDRKITSRGR